MTREYGGFIRLYWQILLECLRVAAYVVFIVGVMWMLFAVEPGKGWSWPF